MFHLHYLKNTLTGVRLIKKVQVFQQLLTKNNKYNGPVWCRLFHSTPKYTCNRKITGELKKNVRSDLLNVNTDVQNNVILFKDIEQHYIQKIRYIMALWCATAAVMAYALYTPEFVSLWHTDLSFTEYLDKIGILLFLFLYAISIGPSTLYFAWWGCRRCIKYIVLHKGGTNVTFITYDLFKKDRNFTVPVKKVTCQKARTDTKNYLPIKIQGHSFFYPMDCRGLIFNEVLFDSTVGAARRW